MKERTTSTLKSVALASALVGVLFGMPLALRDTGVVDAPEAGGLWSDDRAEPLADSDTGEEVDGLQEPPELVGILDAVEEYERPAASELSDRALRVVGTFGAEFPPLARYERLRDWGNAESLAFDPHLPGRYVSIGWFEGRPGAPPTLGAPSDTIVQVDGVDIAVAKDFAGVSLAFRVGTTDVLFVVEATVPMVRVEEPEQGELAEWMLSLIADLTAALAADG